METNKRITTISTKLEIPLFLNKCIKYLQRKKNYNKKEDAIIYILTQWVEYSEEMDEIKRILGVKK